MPVPSNVRPTLLALETREVPVASLQFLQQSPYAAAAVVDVYVNDAKLLNDVPFRQATAFLGVPDSVPLKIDIVAGAAADNKAPLTTRTVTLPPNGQAVAALVGNPADTTGTTRVTLALSTAARAASADPAATDFAVLQASPDAPAVTVKLRGGGAVASGVAYAAFGAGYTSVRPGKYVVDVTAADGVTPVGSYNLDLTAAAGTARTLALGGFVAPKFPTDPALALVAVDGKGFGTILTRAAPFGQTKYAVGGDGTATLYNFDGKPGVTVTLPRYGTRVPTASDASTDNARTNPLRVAVGDVNNDGVADLVTAVGPDAQPGLPAISQVSVYDGATGALLKSLTPFESGFTGGLFVAVADLDGDGYADLVLTPDQGGGPRVQVLSGKSSTPLVPDFFGIADPAFRGGARPALADVNGDGTPDLIVAAGFGGGPRVAVFNGLSLLPGGVPGRLLPDFFAFESTLRNGAFVAGGDLDGDGLAEVVAGGGPGGGPRVLALSGKDLLASTSTLTAVANFFALVKETEEWKSFAPTKSAPSRPPPSPPSTLASSRS